MSIFARTGNSRIWRCHTSRICRCAVKAIELMCSIASAGMEYLHSRQVVHFDLKCDNLLADLRSKLQPLVKIGDMGLSKYRAATFMSGNMRGTLPWMAPEMFPAMSASKSGSGHQV